MNDLTFIVVGALASGVLLGIMLYLTGVLEKILSTEISVHNGKVLKYKPAMMNNDKRFSEIAVIQTRKLRD